MRRYSLLLPFVLLGLLPACDILAPEEPIQRTVVVHHHARECMGLDPQLCLLVRDVRTEQFGNHFGGIEGFDFEWGFVYRLHVEEHPLHDPAADGSSILMVLRREESRERVPPGTEFEIILSGGETRVVEVDSDRYRIYGSAEFTCSDPVDCDALGSRIAEGARIRYRFAHPAEPSDPLMVLEWEPCDGDESLVGSATC